MTRCSFDGIRGVRCRKGHTLLHLCRGHQPPPRGLVTLTVELAASDGFGQARGEVTGPGGEVLATGTAPEACRFLKERLAAKEQWLLALAGRRSTIVRLHRNDGSGRILGEWRVQRGSKE